MKKYTINIQIDQTYTEDEYALFQTRMNSFGATDEEVITEILKDCGLIDGVLGHSVSTRWEDI